VRYAALILSWLCLTVLFVTGCDRNDTSSSDSDEKPFPEQKVAGIWWGYISSQESAVDKFVFGVISEENEVRLVSDDSQFVGPEGALAVDPATVFVNGAFSEYLYDDTTPADYFDVTSSTRDYTGFILARALVLMEPTEKREIGQLYYSTTYEEVPPNIMNLKGVWHLANTTGFGGKISLVITPSLANTTNGEIRVKRDMSETDITTGTDILNPGTIRVYYSNDRAYNIYNVNLSTLDSPDSIDLAGFAAYINEYDTNGVVISRSMAVGVSSASSEDIKSFSGLASFYKTLAP